jgi:hypothetical protein
MPKSLAIFLLLVLAACARPDAACNAPFDGIETSGASQADQLILREASEDFCAVMAGKEPVHAKPAPGGGPSDGGTLPYIGRGYKLTALNSLSQFGSFRGVARGPILEFEAPFAPGHTTTVSSVRVYATPETR